MITDVITTAMNDQDMVGNAHCLVIVTEDGNANEMISRDGYGRWRHVIYQRLLRVSRDSMSLLASFTRVVMPVTLSQIKIAGFTGLASCCRLVTLAHYDSALREFIARHGSRY